MLIRKIHLLVILSVIALGVAVLLSLSSTQRNAKQDQNSAVPQEQGVSIMNRDAGSDIRFPYFGGLLTIPSSLAVWSPTDIRLLQENPDLTDRACGMLSKTTKNGNMLWFQYRDDQNPLCGTEATLPFSQNIEADIGDENALCPSLMKKTIYADCRALAISPEQVLAASFFQYIPDYLEERKGTIARVTVFLRTDRRENRMLVLALVPKSLQIVENAFQEEVRRLQDDAATDVGFMQETDLLSSVEQSYRRVGP